MGAGWEIEETYPTKMTFLGKVSIGMTKHHDSNLSYGGKGFGLTCPDHSLSLEEIKQDWNPEAEAYAEAIEGSCLLAYLTCLAQPSLKPGLSVQEWPQTHWTGPSPTVH